MRLAIIGGSLLGKMQEFTRVTEERIKTPFGQPSDTFVSGTIDDIEVVYFNRHGNSHHLAPHQINYRANMFVLKILEVTDIIAVTAVGGITEKMSPMTWVVPDQIIDYSYGRMQTYNDGNDKEVKHIDFSYPFENNLRKKLQTAVEMENLECVSQATYGVTQGPRLETIAEINRMQNDGCDIVGMTAMPEAALARELDMNYATLSLVVNWAAGKGNVDGQEAEIIFMEEIGRRISEGNKISEKLVRNIV